VSGPQSGDISAAAREIAAEDAAYRRRKKAAEEAKIKENMSHLAWVLRRGCALTTIDGASDIVQDGLNIIDALDEEINELNQSVARKDDNTDAHRFDRRPRRWRR